MQAVFQGSRELLKVLGVVATPLVIAVMAAIVFALPAQVLEVYRIYALNTVLSWVPAKQIAILYGSIVGVLVLSAACYVACEILLARFGRQLELETPPGRSGLLCAPFVAGALPLVGVAAGLYRASRSSAGTPELEDTPTRIARELAYKIGIDNPSSEMLASFQGETARILAGLDTRLLAAAVGVVLLSAVFLAVLYFIQRFVARSPLGTRALVRWGMLGFCFLLLISAFVGFTASPTQVPLAIGPLIIICLFFVFLLVGFGSLSFLSQAKSFPFTFLVVLWMSILAVAGCNDNHEVRYLKPAASGGDAAATPAALPSLEQCLKVWFESRPDRASGERFARGQERYPIYIVAAQGGGVFAAHHSAVFLAGVRRAAPGFEHHLFAVSGVSGGSVGSALYAAALDLEQQIAGKPASTTGPPCAANPDAARPPKSEASKLNILNFVDDGVLSYDLLSPLVGATAFPDFLQRFIPISIPALDRARALEYGLQDAWKETVNEEILEEGREADERRFDDAVRERVKATTALIEKPYIAHWNANGSTPALLFNTTEIGSGRRRVFSPFSFGDGEVPFFEGAVPGRASLVTAAVLSARFPWITPAGWIKHAGGAGVRRYVDGGYFENSGVATALQLFESINRAAVDLDIAEKITVKIIALTGQPEDVTDEGLAGGFSEFGDPIRALLSTWSARGQLSVREAERRLNHGDQKPLLRVTLRPIRHPLPLGWMLSDVTRLLIRLQKGDPGRCTEARRERLRLQDTAGQAFDADCVVADISRAIGG